MSSRTKATIKNGQTHLRSGGLWIGIALLIGALIGFLIGHAGKKAVAVSSTESIRESDISQYPLIHPLLAVERSDMDTPSPQYAALDKSVNQFIASQTASGAITAASVYFINYGKGGSFAINDSDPYTPASLLKVVVMVAYLKESDTDQSIMEKELTYAPDIAQSLQDVPFSSPSELKVGNTYDVSTLINDMITDSDNGAMNLLIDNIDANYLNTVYANLGLQSPATNSAYTISAKDYSLFFRVLYNATYLSEASSEKALSILSQATFKDGLVAGMPAGTVVAHKFGEAVNGTGDQISSVELHDCGIVYPSSGGPYLLCVMTKGKSLDSLESTISGISKMVYQAAAVPAK